MIEENRFVQLGAIDTLNLKKCLKFSSDTPSIDDHAKNKIRIS